MEQKFTELKGKTEQSILIVGEVDIPLTNGGNI